MEDDLVHTLTHGIQIIPNEDENQVEIFLQCWFVHFNHIKLNILKCKPTNERL